ncbi:hypothetical protein MTO96_007224 [Rhipicephalus appendiculatus]
MDAMYTAGAHMTKHLQENFDGYDRFFSWISFAADPPRNLLWYYPIALTFSNPLGVRILIAASCSEFLNVAIKWILNEHRPFWYVKMKSHIGIQLAQTPQTCETGPGSPSGHVMVTAAVLYVVIRYAISCADDNTRSQRRRRYVRAILWPSYFLYLSAVGASRVFIGAHFPHQVLLGIRHRRRDGILPRALRHRPVALSRVRLLERHHCHDVRHPLHRLHGARRGPAEHGPPGARGVRRPAIREHQFHGPVQHYAQHRRSLGRRHRHVQAKRRPGTGGCQAGPNLGQIVGRTGGHRRRTHLACLSAAQARVVHIRRCVGPVLLLLVCRYLRHSLRPVQELQASEQDPGDASKKGIVVHFLRRGKKSRCTCKVGRCKYHAGQTVYCSVAPVHVRMSRCVFISAT